MVHVIYVKITKHVYQNGQSNSYKAYKERYRFSSLLTCITTWLFLETFRKIVTKPHTSSSIDSILPLEYTGFTNNRVNNARYKC